MKKIIYVFILAAAMFLIAPLSSYAGHSAVHHGASIRLVRGGWGWHGGWHHGFWGPRFFWGPSIVIGSPWYPYGYYGYSAPPVVIEQQPQTYVQPQSPQENYWYYCQNPQGYYPYVQNCPGGWMKVVPRSAPPK